MTPPTLSAKREILQRLATLKEWHDHRKTTSLLEILRLFSHYAAYDGTPEDRTAALGELRRLNIPMAPRRGSR